MADVVSRRYKPDPQACCEACVFGRGEHAPHCGKGQERCIPRAQLMDMPEAEFAALEGKADLVGFDLARSAYLYRYR